MIVDLDVLRAATPRDRPFRYVVTEGFLSAVNARRVADAYPTLDVPGIFLPESAPRGEALDELVHDLAGDEMRRAVEEKLDVDLSGRPALITLRNRCRPSDGAIHTDSKTKLASLLLYVNEGGWNAPGGRLRILNSGDDIDDWAEEIAPDAGNLVLFRVQHNSWHGHTRYAGPRRCVMVNYFCDAAVRDAEARRHKGSLYWKKLRRAVFGPGRTQNPVPRGRLKKDNDSATALDALRSARSISEPFRHFEFTNLLPDAVARALAQLPVPAPRTSDHPGRRDAVNSSRVFFAPWMQARHPICAKVATIFRDSAVVTALERLLGSSLRGSFLRIEYCQDGDGFWLEPHTDIGAKLATLTVFLSDEPGAEDWGTDLYDTVGRRVGRVPAGFNRGYAFAPGPDTWHGVERRTFGGVRRSIIVNYVKAEWRSRHELASPVAIK